MLFSLIFFIFAYFFLPDKSYNYIAFSKWNIDILGKVVAGYGIALWCGYQAFKLFLSSLEHDRFLKKWTARYSFSMLCKLIGIAGTWVIGFLYLYMIGKNFKISINSDAMFYIGIIASFIGLLLSFGVMISTEDEIIKWIYSNIAILIPSKLKPRAKKILSLQD